MANYQIVGAVARKRFVALGLVVVALVLIVTGMLVAGGNSPHPVASASRSDTSSLNRSELRASTRIDRAFDPLLSDYSKDEIGAGATQCATFNQVVSAAPVAHGSGGVQTDYETYLASESEVGQLCREVFNLGMSSTNADAMAHEQSVADHEVALFARSIGQSVSIPAIETFGPGASSVTPPTGSNAGFAILSPQTSPPISAECSQSLAESADGNASPLSCPSGGVNVLAWGHYASVNLSVMRLGRSATEVSVYAAMCTDTASGHSTYPIESSAEQLVALYNGWTFGNSAQFTSYVGADCPAATVAEPKTASVSTIARPTCPSGSPHVSISISYTQDAANPDYWNITLNGIGTNNASAPLTILSADVQLTDSSNDALQSLYALPGGVETPTTLDPGQSVAISTAATVLLQSSGPPRIGSVHVIWEWPATSPYLSCPHGVG